MSFQKQQASAGSVPSFPPPPMSATLQREQAKRKTKLRTTSTESTTAEKYTPLQKSRLFLLPLLLVITFIVLILGVIYAYCVASPHTMLTDAQLASPEDIEIDSSIFSRRNMDASSWDQISKRAAMPSTDSTEDDLTSATLEPTSTGAADYPRNKSSLSAALIFYTATSPLFAVLVISAELLLALSSTSEEPTSPSVVSQTIEPRRHSRIARFLRSRRAHLIFLGLIFVNVCSLAITASFWTHCEIPSPVITQNALMCPKELRGHWMGGIHEVSLAKVILSWLVIFGSVAHAYVMFRNMKAERRRWAVHEDQEMAKEIDVVVELTEKDVEKGKSKSSRVRFL